MGRKTGKGLPPPWQEGASYIARAPSQLRARHRVRPQLSFGEWSPCLVEVAPGIVSRGARIQGIPGRASGSGCCAPHQSRGPWGMEVGEKPPPSF